MGLLGCIPSGGSKGEFVILPFPASRSSYILWLMTPSSHYPYLLLGTLILLPPFYKEPLE